VTTYRAILILAGAFAVVLIAVAAVMKPHAVVSAPLTAAMLLGVYAIGLGLGQLLWNRRG
jgi:energy-converting hydrogenase Eha subunit E